MKPFVRAINLICCYEGFSEKAYPDPKTGGAPYTIGFGTQFYPDGLPVLRGQCCTRKRALQYLEHELQVISEDLEKVNLVLDDSMKEALLSFIHSIGWQPFLYSRLIDDIGNEDWQSVVDEISQWIFDEDHHVIGGLLDRRREEAKLFLSEINDCPSKTIEILLNAFRNYSGKCQEIKAIRALESSVNPYALAEFANEFYGSSGPWDDFKPIDGDTDSEFLFSTDEWD